MISRYAPKRKLVRIASLAALLALLLGACAAEPVEFPYGDFKSVGSEYISFAEDGTWTFGLAEGSPLVGGQFRLEGSEITFSDEVALQGNNPLCPPEDGIYTWSYEDEVLTFEVISDPCGFRIGDFDARFTPIP